MSLAQSVKEMLMITDKLASLDLNPGTIYYELQQSFIKNAARFRLNGGEKRLEKLLTEEKERENESKEK